MYIEVISTRKEAVRPYCKVSSAKSHSHYKRSFQDMPIQGIKVIIILNNKKMFCMNSDCKYKTFAESFEFLYPKAKKSKRLETEIINLAINISSISASSILKSHVAGVGKSTICMEDFALKKRETHGTIMIDIITHRIIDLIPQEMPQKLLNG